MKSLGVVLLFVAGLFFFTQGEIYFGCVSLSMGLLSLFTVALSSPYGDFSKTAKEIKEGVAHQRKIDSSYLSYPEQRALKEKQERQRIVSGKFNAMQRQRVNAQRVALGSTCVGSSLDDIHETTDVFVSDSSMPIFSDNCQMPIEEIYVNPTTGQPIICGMGGMGGIDAGGHVWGEPDSFSSSNDTFSSFDDSNDSFSSITGEW